MSDSTTDSDAAADAAWLIFYRDQYATSLLSSTGYGLYLAFSGIAVYLLLANGAIYTARRLTLAYTGVMFVVTTIWYVTGARASAYLFVDDVGVPEALELTTKVCAMLQFLLSDTVMLFRLYMSWNRDLRIMVIPCLMYIVCIVFGALAELYCVSTWFESRSQTLRAVFLSTTVALNAFATLAIAYRVLVIMRDASQFKNRNRGIEQRARAILVVIVESGALYSLVGIIAIIYFCAANPVASALVSLFQILSFVNPAFIILRVAMGISYEYDVPQAISGQPLTNDTEKALPPIPFLRSQRESAASMASLVEKESVIMVARRVDVCLR